MQVPRLHHKSVTNIRLIFKIYLLNRISKLLAELLNGITHINIGYYIEY